jgi:hypothetical protein
MIIKHHIQSEPPISGRSGLVGFGPIPNIEAGFARKREARPQ